MGKRIMDILAGGVLALVAIPLVLCLAVLVAVSLRTARPFFVQRRAGRDGQMIRVVKLRTLPVRTPAYAPKDALVAFPTTRLCAWLRLRHLDELPQLLLVPLGTMSLVGPRPEMHVLLEHFDPGFTERRSSVRPGCTGLWQVSVESPRMIGDAPEYDLFYVAHQSFRLDLWVLWRTAGLLVGLRPAIRLADVPGWIPRTGTIAVEEQAGTDTSPTRVMSTAGAVPE